MLHLDTRLPPQPSPLRGRLAAGVFFPGGLLLGGRSLRMPGTGLLRREAQAPQVHPALLRVGGPPGVVVNPSRHFRPRPEATIRCWTVKQGSQHMLLGRRQERGFAWIGGAAIRQTSRTVLVIALNQQTDPFVAQPDCFCSSCRRSPRTNQPEGVIATRFGGRARRLVPVPKLVR